MLLVSLFKTHFPYLSAESDTAGHSLLLEIFSRLGLSSFNCLTRVSIFRDSAVDSWLREASDSAVSYANSYDNTQRPVGLSSGWYLLMSRWTMCWMETTAGREDTKWESSVIPTEQRTQQKVLPQEHKTRWMLFVSQRNTSPWKSCLSGGVNWQPFV